MDELLVCRDLAKSYGTKQALKGINFTLVPGRVVGLMGPNGSGKTTFLKIANGLLTPTSGEVTICGKKPDKETKQLVSYLPDADYLPGAMSIRSLVKMYQDFFKDFDAQRAYSLIDYLHLDLKAKFKTLSKGNKEKVQLILAMSRQAKLYLLDEPIGGVDPAARDYILNTILQNHAPDATIVISTHQIADVEQVIDDCIFIKEGELILYMPANDLRVQMQKSVDQYFREVFRC